MGIAEAVHVNRFSLKLGNFTGLLIESHLTQKTKEVEIFLFFFFSHSTS